MTTTILPLTYELPARLRSAVALTTGAMLACTIAYALYVVTGVGAGRIDGLANDWIYNATLVLATAVCALRALTGRARLAWAALAAGMAAWAVGDIYWAIAYADLGDPPFPSISDALYIGLYPFAYGAIVLLVRSSAERFHPSVWLDGLIGMLSIAGLTVAFAIAPILSGVGGKLAEVATNVAYPVGDLLLALMVVGVFALAGWAPSRGWLLLGLGFIVLAVADTAYLFMVARDTYVEGEWLDALWPLGIALLAIAAWQRPGEFGAVRFRGWSVMVVPAVFATASLGLLVVAGFTPIEPVALVFATASIVVVIARTAMTFSEVQQLAEAREQALTDDLTGLPNRRMLYAELDHAIAAAAGDDDGLGLMMVDLDQFKEVNDALGHHAGDALLREIGPRLSALLGSGQTLARVGGDEFAVVARGAAGIEQLAERFREALRRPFMIAGLSLQIDASMGIALYPQHGDDSETLMQRADIAMYEAKRSHIGYAVYAQERDRRSRDRLLVVGRLRRAIEHDELLLHFQPVIDLRTGAVAGAEALVRWDHPERGLLLPDDFLPAASRTALMHPLTLQVLDLAIHEQAGWAASGGGPGCVSVNVPGSILLDSAFPRDLDELLAAAGVSPDCLRLELTEDAILSDPESVATMLHSLADRGIELSLDDFGTGYSSLSHLRQLSVDELKIDRSFVMRMRDDENDAAIVRSVIALGQSLGLSLVAEGVEDEETLATIRELGCDLAQGYLFSRPIPPDRFTEWYAQWKPDLVLNAGTARAPAAD